VYRKVGFAAAVVVAALAVVTAPAAAHTRSERSGSATARQLFPSLVVYGGSAQYLMYGVLDEQTRTYGVDFRSKHGAGGQLATIREKGAPISQSGSTVLVTTLVSDKYVYRYWTLPSLTPHTFNPPETYIPQTAAPGGYIAFVYHADGQPTAYYIRFGGQITRLGRLLPSSPADQGYLVSVAGDGNFVAFATIGTFSRGGIRAGNINQPGHYHWLAKARSTGAYTTGYCGVPGQHFIGCITRGEPHNRLYRTSGRLVAKTTATCADVPASVGSAMYYVGVKGCSHPGRLYELRKDGKLLHSKHRYAITDPIRALGALVLISRSLTSIVSVTTAAGPQKRLVSIS
jgi:hypothetical protein